MLQALHTQYFPPSTDEKTEAYRIKANCHISEFVYDADRTGTSVVFLQSCVHGHGARFHLLPARNRHILAIRNGFFLEEPQERRANLDDRRKIVAEHTSVTKSSLKIPGVWTEINGNNVLLGCRARITAPVEQQGAGQTSAGPCRKGAPG